MHFLDLRTLVFINVITNLVCTLVMIQLWMQARKRYHGVSFLVTDFALQTAGLLLVVLRGAIPDWVSIIPSNVLVIAGAVMGLIGLERFTGKRGPQLHNVFLLALFAGIQIYFTVMQPSLAMRNLNISATLFIITLQCVTLLLYRVPKTQRPLTRFVAGIFAAYAVISVVRIFYICFTPKAENDFFKSGSFDTALFTVYNLLLILLAYGLVLMINKRLFNDVGAQEKKFYKAFQSSPYAVSLTTIPDGRITEVNAGFERIFGYTADQVLGRTTSELNLWVHAEDRTSGLQRLMKQGELHDVEYLFRTRSGEQFTTLFSAVLLAIDGQEVILSTISDISERKCNENRLRENEERFRTVADYTYDWEYWRAPDGSIRYMSPSCERITGYRVEDFIADPSLLETLVVPEDAQLIAKHRHEAVNDDDRNNIHEVEFRMLRRDGEMRWIGHTCQHIRRGDGTDLGMRATNRDITGRKLAEDSLRGEKDRIRTILDMIGNPIFVKDNDHRITLANSAFYAMFGLDEKSVLGKTLVESVPENERHHFLKVDRSVLDTGTPDVREEELTVKDYTRTIITRKIRYIDENGKRFLVGSIHDITERKRSEEALRENEHKYRTLFDTAGDAILLFTDGRWIDCNTGALKIFGCTREQIIGAHPGKFSPPTQPDGRSSEEESHRMINRAYMEGPQLFEWVHCRADATTFAAEVSLNRLDLGGKPYMQAIVRDISNRKLAEEKLKRSDEQYREAQEMGLTGHWQFNPVSQEFTGSPEAMRIYGFPADASISFADIAKCISIREVERVTQALFSCIQDGKEFNEEFEMCPRNSKETRILLSIGKMKKDATCGTEIISGILQDITERRRAEDELHRHREHLEELVRERTASLEKVNLAFQQELIERERIEEKLRASETKYHGLYDSISDGIVMVDIDGKIIEYNQAYRNMLGYADDELRELTYKDITPIRWHEIEASIVTGQILPRGYSDEYEKEYLRNDGTVIPVSLKTWLIRDAKDAPLGMWARVHDISERKAAETALRRLNEELERRVAERTAELGTKNKEMEQLIYVTSHDLRSPLVNVQGFNKELAISLREIIAALADMRIPDDIRQKVIGRIEKDILEEQHYIGASVQKMEILLSGLLKISRLGRMEFKQETVDMNALLFDVLAAFEYQIQTAKLVLSVSHLPPCVGDRTQLDHVFSNLIGNAVKYLDPSRPGMIFIHGRVENNMAVYCVEDNGIGIAKEHQERIFEIFHRLNPSATEGEGIGLAIVRRIVDRSMGKVWLTSESGKGSSFYVALPLPEESKIKNQ